TAGNGNAIVVIVFQDTLGAGNRINQSGGRSRAEISGRCADGAGRAGGTVGHVEQEVSFLDCPAVVASSRDAVNLLDIVLPHVGFDQIAGDRVKGKAIGIAQTVSVDLRNLARPLVRIVG